MKHLPYPNTVCAKMMDAPPNAVALISGNKTYPEISGIVKFYE